MGTRRERKRRFKKIYRTCKRTAFAYLQAKNYEGALSIVSVAANFMYNVNLVYVDKELEQIIYESACQYISFDQSGMQLNEEVVAFYDEFGLDNRGLALIYLEAFLSKGYHVMYITRAGKEIPRIQKLLGGDGRSSVYYIERASYKEETGFVLQIIKDSGAKAFFVYDLPSGITGSLAAHALKGSGVASFKINLTDHAFWLGAEATDFFIEFRDYGANISSQYRNISRKKLLKLPYYPQVNEEMEFQGFPFKINENTKVVFSGGALYKTYSVDGLYYYMVEEILKRYDEVIFWYAGKGNTTEFDNLIEKYPDRIFRTDERKDLFQILRHCYFYLSTYPITGGLMGQYAVNAGRIPVTLLRHEECHLVLENASGLGCEFYSASEVLDFIDRIMRDDGFLELKEKYIEENVLVIGKNVFADNLQQILEKKQSSFSMEIQKVELGSYSNIFVDNFDEKKIPKLLWVRRTKKLKKFKKAFSKKGMVKYGMR
ncbi:MAG: hypothetical protein HFH72_04355 [Lachnospiraceae bacterium]|nr:hypothetical protein [Lachnospiraceae bacterium]